MSAGAAARENSGSGITIVNNRCFVVILLLSGHQTAVETHNRLLLIRRFRLESLQLVDFLNYLRPFFLILL
jgi:hypothetical protein